MRPGLLGQADERERRHQTALGVLPADERLEPDDPVGPEVDDRLVVGAQLVALEGAPEVALEIEALERLGAHRRVEQREVPGRIALGPDHRDLGLAQQLVRGDPARLARERCRSRR